MKKPQLSTPKLRADSPRLTPGGLTSESPRQGQCHHTTMPQAQRVTMAEPEARPRAQRVPRQSQGRPRVSFCAEFLRRFLTFVFILFCCFETLHKRFLSKTSHARMESSPPPPSTAVPPSTKYNPKILRLRCNTAHWSGIRCPFPGGCPRCRRLQQI